MYVIGDTIRFTAGIRKLNGQLHDPTEVRIEIKKPNGKILFEGIAEKESTGNYYYDWTISEVIDKSNIIAIFIWEEAGKTNKKRLKFKVVPETDY